MRILRQLGAWVALLALGAVAVFTVLWFSSGGHLYSVPTGSMLPAIHPGDAVFVRPTTFKQLRVGQVVSYRDRNQPRLITTHRIVNIDVHNRSLTTKGDHNPQADLPIAYQQVIGEAVMVGPKLGTTLTWLRHPIGLAVVIYLPAVTLLFLELSRLQRRQGMYYGR